MSAMRTLKKSECRSGCPLASALDLLGDRWTLLVIRDLILMGKHEYHEFVKGPEGIATNILSDRLKRLVQGGLVASCPHPRHKTKKLYYLTTAGKELLPVLMELILWSGTHRPPPTMPKARFDYVKRNPKKFMRQTLKDLEAWEAEQLR